MRELRLVLLGLAAVIALLLGAGFLMRAFKTPERAPVAQVEAPAATAALPPPADADGDPVAPPEPASPASLPPVSTPRAPTAARQAVDRMIADVPDYTRFFDRLRLAFPSDYETIINQFATVASGGGEVNVDAMLADAVSALRRAHGSLAAQASDVALAQVFALQLREMQALAARDAHLCVAFLYGANGGGFQAFAAEHRALVADAAIAGLDAISSGSLDPIKRAPPSDADFQLLDRALVDKGLSRPEIEALLDGKIAVPPIPDDAMCRAGQTYLQTLASLPADIRMRLYGLAVDIDGDSAQAQTSRGGAP